MSTHSSDLFNPDLDPSLSVMPASQTPTVEVATSVFESPFNIESVRLQGEIGAINLEFLQAGIDRGALGFLGLRRVITEKRAHRAAEKGSELLTSADVHKEVTEAVLDQRLPVPELYPVTRSEERAALRASRRRTKAMMRESNKIRLQSIYGATDAMGRPFYKDNRPSYVIEDGKIRVNRLSIHENDLGTNAQIERLKTERYTSGNIPVLRKIEPGSRISTIPILRNIIKPGGRVGAELNAAKAFHKDEEIAGRIRDKLQRSIDGDDLRTRNLRYQAERHLDRAKRLDKRLKVIDRDIEARHEQIDERKARRKKNKRANQEKRAERQEQSRRGVI